MSARYSQREIEKKFTYVDRMTLSARDVELLARAIAESRKKRAIDKFWAKWKELLS